MLSEVSSMISADLLDSAEMALSFHLSQPHCALCLGYELFGDVLCKRGHAKRALSKYEIALQNVGVVANDINATAADTVHGEEEKKSDSFIDIESRIKSKQSKCYIALKDNSSAVKVLETIAPKSRTVEMNMSLARLYQKNCQRRLAIAAYKAILEKQPLAMEAVTALLSLGYDKSELKTFYDNISKLRGGSEEYSTAMLARWLPNVFGLETAKHHCDYEVCQHHYSELTKLQQANMSNKNVWLMLRMAKCAHDADQLDVSRYLYEQVRSVDPLIIEGMHDYGYLLFTQNDKNALNGLTNDILYINNGHATGWLLASMFCECRKEDDTTGDTNGGNAKTFVEKAIQLDPSFAAAFVFKGHLHLSQGHHEQATIAFYQANSLCKTLESYKGLVTANLTLGKTKEAMVAAKESISLMPNCAATYLLYAKCLSRSPNSTVDTLKAYNKALEIDPCNFKAAGAISDICVMQGKLHEASTCLKDILDRKSDYSIRIQLAKVLTTLAHYAEAMQQLQLAIGERPNDNLDAVNELERVETVMSEYAVGGNIHE